MKSLVILTIIVSLGLTACASTKPASGQQYAPNKTAFPQGNRNNPMSVASKMISPAM